MKKTEKGSGRYIFVAVIFCVVCLAFLITLGAVQWKGTDLPPAEKGYTRTYTVPGVRGEIYDRNGKKIVGNSDKYDLIYEYGAMPDTRTEVNRALLAVMKAIRDTGNEYALSENRCALEGTYPNMTLRAEAKNKDTAVYSAYEKFLERQKLKREDTTAADVQSYYVKRYKIYTEYYTEQEITDLIRLYYEMERVDFGQYASYTIAEGISPQLIAAIEEKNIEGVNFQINTERVYYYPGVASHILGRLGRITAENAEYYTALGYSLDALVGTSGCEMAFESYLRGVDGVEEIKYDENGNFLERYYVSEPKSGNDVYLTIDIELQIAAEKALDENVKNIEASDAGAVTVLDPNSGEILAVASNPTYDLSKFDDKGYYNSLVSNENLPLYNRALQGVYAPGSTYKMGVAIAALENGYIDQSSLCYCNQYYTDLSGKSTGHTCLEIHKDLDVVGAIRESCNVFFYRLGELMGIEKVTPYTEKLGLGAKTGLELGDKAGMIAGPDYRDAPWYLGDDLNAAIGQSDHGYTPLQMSIYLSSIVNGGTRYNATILDSVRNHSKETLVEGGGGVAADKLSDGEYSEETRQLLIEAMIQVVNQEGREYENGTGHVHEIGYFKDLPVTVGGKTGTAQVDGKRDYAIFSGFAPAEAPEIVVSCILEEGVYGYRAAYTVEKIMEKYFEGRGESTQTP